MENTLVAVPAERPESIGEILDSLKRYDALCIKELQEYLEKQVSGNFQDLNSNLALLKLYNLANTEIDAYLETEHHTVQILLKGLVNFPYTDFNLYLNLLPSYTLVNEQAPFVNSFNEKVQKLVQVYSLLSSSKLSEFWTVFNTDPLFKEIVSKHFHSAENLKSQFQKTIVALVSITYNSIKPSLLKHFLDTTEIDSFVKLLNWTVSGDVVLVSEKEVIKTKTVIASEQVKLEQVNSIIRKALEN